MKRDATALRAITHADDSFEKNQVLLGMDAGQFNDWEGAGLVRAATDAEIAKAKGEKTAPAKRKNAPRARKTAKPSTPVAASAGNAPADPPAAPVVAPTE
jgi:hypothetical protein